MFPALFAGGMVRELNKIRWPENELLSALSEKDRSRLLPQLEILTLFAKEELHQPDADLTYVYFPLDSIVALVSSVDLKATVEVGLIGHEGMVGAQIMMGAKKATNQAVALSEGKALRLPAQVLKKQAKRSSTMREVLFPYAHALLAQSSRLAACHRYHTPQARLVRLLLMIADRSRSDELRITQETLARLLGTRRATVTDAANQLHKKGLIESHRGRSRILDRTKIEDEACTCYQIILTRAPHHQSPGQGNSGTTNFLTNVSQQ